MPLLQKLRKGDKQDDVIIREGSSKRRSKQVTSASSSSSPTTAVMVLSSSSPKNNHNEQPIFRDFAQTPSAKNRNYSGPVAADKKKKPQPSTSSRKKEPWEKAVDQERHRYTLKEISDKLIAENRERRNSLATAATEEETTKGSAEPAASPLQQKIVSSSSLLASMLPGGIPSSWHACTPLVRPKGRIKVRTACQLEQQGNQENNNSFLAGIFQYALCPGDLCGGGVGNTADAACANDYEEERGDDFFPEEGQFWEEYDGLDQSPIPREISYTNSLWLDESSELLPPNRYSLVEPSTKASSTTHQEEETSAAPATKEDQSWVKRVLLKRQNTLKEESRSHDCGPTVMDKLKVYVDTGALCSAGADAEGSVASDITTPESIRA
jgi:hypothetical protein